MKKHFVLIMNIVLVLAILGAVAFTIVKMVTRDAGSDTHSPDNSSGKPVSASASATQYPSVDPAERYKIGIVQHYNNADSNDCYAGFISEMNERELIGNVDVVYIIEEDKDRCKKEIQRLINEKCDLLCTIGPYASKVAASLTDKIPIVFAGVAEPEKEGLVDTNEKPGGNVTGVSSYPPTFEQISLIKTLLPQTKKIAAMYSSTDEDAVTQAILAEDKAEELGMTTERYPITKTEEFQAAFDEIKEKGVRALFLPTDAFILKNMKTILKFTNANKLPVFVGNEKMLKAGAFATCSINYTSIGKMAAVQCCDILFGKAEPATLQVVYKHDCYNLVNQASMETLGVSLNQTMLDQVQVKEY